MYWKTRAPKCVHFKNNLIILKCIIKKTQIVQDKYIQCSTNLKIKAMHGVHDLIPSTQEA